MYVHEEALPYIYRALNCWVAVHKVTYDVPRVEINSVLAEQARAQQQLEVSSRGSVKVRGKIVQQWQLVYKRWRRCAVERPMAILDSLSGFASSSGSPGVAELRSLDRINTPFASSTYPMANAYGISRSGSHLLNSHLYVQPRLVEFSRED